jgi:signal transduction histidine kinase
MDVGEGSRLDASGLNAEALLAGQNRALELVASGASLVEVLDYLTRFIEAQGPGLRCSILLLDGDRLRHGAAPSLPPDYSLAIDGLVIGPCVGACGAAAHAQASVVSRDIANDPAWQPFRDLALSCGLRACWSTPIRSGAGAVLGTFAVYYAEPGEPGAREQRLVEVATHLAGIAIERERTDRALRERAEALAVADRRKDEFLALLAHELRNPLAAIAGAADVLALRPGDEEAVARGRALLGRQVRHLARLVDDLLDVSRITRGEIVLVRERCAAAAFVARAVELARPQLDQRRHELTVRLPDEEIVLDVDPVRFTQVLANVLDNAAKYTPPGGHVALSVEASESEVVFRVVDDGIGVSRELRPHVFDLFVQGERGLAHTAGGLGVGLTLARKLVELHGGSVSLSSEGEGRGAEVLVRVPRARGAEVARASTPAGASPARERPRRVLVVDDNADAAETLVDVVQCLGGEARSAHDGVAALACAAEFEPDLAFVDIGLPGMDGYEVARRLRASRPAASLRLVALTGYGQPSDRRAAEAAGFDAHLVKPASLERIEAEVRGAA